MPPCFNDDTQPRSLDKLPFHFDRQMDWSGDVPMSMVIGHGTGELRCFKSGLWAHAVGFMDDAELFLRGGSHMVGAA